MKTPQFFLSKLIFSITPHCEEITRIVSHSYDRPLSLKEKIHVQLHILFCKGCHQFVHQLEYLDAFVRKIFREDSFLTPKAELPKEAQMKMQQEITKALENFDN